jgi:2-dehydro-3-deoxyphosphogluconate aldolase/(4S)-4-hydroxy-2-oxoglutarate aldolase
MGPTLTSPTVFASTSLTGARVIPVLRFSTREAAATAIDCLIEAGYRTVEVTLTTPGAVELIAELRARTGPAFLVGAGTVLDLDRARACLDAGADYVVSPAFVPGLAALARERQRGVLLGGFTPSEILAAWREGAHVVKVFPAATGGPAHLAAIHTVYPEIPLCPTGGLSLTNLAAYLEAGAAVVGVGNNVVDKRALVAGDREAVIRHARAFLDVARDGRETT